MIDLGKVKPGRTIRIPFNTFDSNDPSASVTATGIDVGAIQIYKDGSLTQRASTSGFAVDADVDGITGRHWIEINLADNTTAGFFTAGSEYLVAVDGLTVDAGSVNGFIGRFEIGYHGAIHETSIATLASQTSFTLTAGSANNDAYNGCVAVIHDVASAIQIAIGRVSDYTGSTKTVTLAADPGIFTMAAGDNISLMPPASVGVGTLTTLDALDTAQDTQHGTTQSAIGTAQADLDTLTGTDGVTLATAQGNYAPAKAGDQMDLVDAPNATAVAAIQSGLATAAALATVDGNVDAVLVDTGTTLPATLATIAGYIDTEIAAILADTGTTLDGKLNAIQAVTDNLPDAGALTSLATAAAVAALNDISVADILTTQMTESYAANGTAPTLAQALFALHQMLMSFAISSTSLTVRKLDNSTTAFVVTLDDDTNPTSLTRAT